MQKFFVVSVKHTKRSDPYITLWRPDNAGYCYRTEAAGRYEEGIISAHLGYYNSGCDSVAVPVDSLEGLAVKVQPGYLDEEGMVIPNNAKTWKAIQAAFIFDPKYPIRPEYKGAPRANGYNSQGQAPRD